MDHFIEELLRKSDGKDLKDMIAFFECVEGSLKTWCMNHHNLYTQSLNAKDVLSEMPEPMRKMSIQVNNADKGKGISLITPEINLQKADKIVSTYRYYIDMLASVTKVTKVIKTYDECITER